MNLDALNPFVRYARVHEYYSEHNYDSICYDCRFFYVTRGEGRLVADGNEYSILPNTAIFLPPLTRYRFHFDDPYDVYIHVLNFDLCDKFSHFRKSLGTASESSFDKSKILKYEPPTELSVVSVSAGEHVIREAAERCTDAHLNTEAYYRELSSANLKIALLALISDRKKGSEDGLHAAVSEYIKNNYHNPELSNEFIAKEFNYHPYHLSRVMKARTGKTLHEYLLNHRLAIAKNYLSTTPLSVAAIAERVGIPSYSYFIKLFRERNGISPLKYRKMHKNIGF